MEDLMESRPGPECKGLSSLSTKHISRTKTIFFFFTFFTPSIFIQLVSGEPRRKELSDFHNLLFGIILKLILVTAKEA